MEESVLEQGKKSTEGEGVINLLGKFPCSAKNSPLLPLAPSPPAFFGQEYTISA